MVVSVHLYGELAVKRVSHRSAVCISFEGWPRCHKAVATSIGVGLSLKSCSKLVSHFNGCLPLVVIGQY
jgi:hypothetical protein